MAKKKPAKKVVKSKARKVTKSKALKKTKAKVSKMNKAVTEPNYAEILPEMLKKVEKPKVREVHGIIQGVCELHVAVDCMAPPTDAIPSNIGPLKTYEFVLNQSRKKVCMRCAKHQELTGAWDLEPIKGKRIR